MGNSLLICKKNIYNSNVNRIEKQEVFMKLISFVVPCYNSQEYMRHCIDTLLPGGDQVEILIVNDGSSDNTAAIADEYEKKIS